MWDFYLKFAPGTMKPRPIIYQLLPRLFANFNEHCVPGGTIEQNGAGKMNSITSKVLKGIRELGITHIWYTGIIEHSHTPDYSRYGIKTNNPYIIKGKAGSPFAITDYYDIDPDIAVSVPDRMKEFEQLVARTHDVGMKVIIDFIPNHVSREYFSDAKPVGIKDFGADDDTEYFFKPGNDFYYITRQLFSPQIDPENDGNGYMEFPAKASGNDCFTAFPTANDWYETVKLNYGIDYGDGSRHFNPIPPLWFKMLHILRFWASKGIEGFRCDMAFMVPVEFWEWAIPQVKNDFPGIIFIAEIYDVALYREFIYRAGFDYLYDKVNLYDTLRGIERDNLSAARLTSCWQTVEGIAPKMLNFLENHDEQRFASEFYAGDASKMSPSMVATSMMSTGPVMIYSGQELGERASDAEGFSGHDGKTSIFDYWSMPSVRRWLDGGKCDGTRLTAAERSLRGQYARILHLCNSEKAIREGMFFDLMYVNYRNPSLDPHRQFVFLRHKDDDTIFIAVNFGDTECNLDVVVPRHAFEVMNLATGECDALELLTGEKSTMLLSEDFPLKAKVKAHGATVWKLVKKKNKNQSIKYQHK